MGKERELAASYRKAGFKGVTVRKMREGRILIFLVLAKAKRNTPMGQRSATGYPNYVHLATYVPSTNKVFRFSTRWAQK